MRSLDWSQTPLGPVEAWPPAQRTSVSVMRTQTASYLENQPVFFNRQGFVEEMHFTFSCIPIRDEHGHGVGVFNISSETTQQVLGERRFKCIRELSIRTALAQDARDVLDAAREELIQRFGRTESVRHYGGLGLGLWVSRQVTEAHGGTLEVGDMPGGGATFVVELALAERA